MFTLFQCVFSDLRHDLLIGGQKPQKFRKIPRNTQITTETLALFVDHQRVGAPDQNSKQSHKGFLRNIL